MTFSLSGFVSDFTDLDGIDLRSVETRILLPNRSLIIVLFSLCACYLPHMLNPRIKVLLLMITLLIAPITGMSQNQHKIDSLVRVINSGVADSAKVRAYHKLNWEYGVLDTLQGGKYGRAGIELAKTLEDEHFLARIAYNMGWIYFNCMDYPRSVEYFNIAVNAYAKANRPAEVAECSRMLGETYLGAEDYENAVRFTLEALESFESLNDAQGQINSQTTLGSIYYQHDDYPNAINALKEALRVSLEINDTAQAVNCYGNVGLLYSETGNNAEARFYLLKAIDYSEKIRDSITLAASYLNLGLMYYNLDDYDSALIYYEKAHVILEEIGPDYDLSIVLNNIGEVHMLAGDFPKALEFSTRSYFLAIKIGSKENQRDAAYILAQAFSKMEEYDRAYEYMHIYSTLHDSLFNAEKMGVIQELQTKYDVVQTERENELLQIETLEQKQNNYIMGGIGSSIFLISLVVFRGYRQKKKANALLEDKNVTIQNQKDEVEHQKMLIEEKQKEIVDSITYAKRIQRALLASEGLLSKNLGEYFVFYRPKDIVSGDFYWAGNTEDGKFLLLTGDCTGHGVPGAFMSLLNISYLHEITAVKQISEPARILNAQRDAIALALNAEGAENTSWDGMDCTLCSFDRKNNQLILAGAFNPVWIIRNRVLTEYKTDKQPVGRYEVENVSFTQQVIQLEKGDAVYTLTDGFPDQFGGDKGKKYKYMAMKEFLVSISSDSMAIQKQKIEMEFDRWRGDFMQIDDVLVIGILI